MRRPLTAIFAATVALGAFSLFAVQPLVARLILPWFGSAPSVWTSCMLFFQVALLAGYAWADLLTRLRPQTQAIAHAAVLLVTLAALPVVPGEELRPTGEWTPGLAILAVLAVCVGGPFVALSAGAPLLQRWYARAGGRSPYALYAVSNAGSLAALLAYPALVEPWVGLVDQAGGWTLLYALYVGLALVCAWFARGGELAGPVRDGARGPAHTGLCFALSACASAILLGATNQLSQDVAVTSVTWIAPLAVYLLSFVLCFSGEARYPERALDLLLPLGLGAAAFALLRGPELGLGWQLVAHLSALACAVTVCHGELYRLRPPISGLTRFYLAIAAGGAAGGLFVALLAPVIGAVVPSGGLLTGYWEYPAALALCPALAALARRRTGRRRPWPMGHTSLPAALCVLTPIFGLQIRPGGDLTALQRLDEAVIARDRGFFGVLQVVDIPGDEASGGRRSLVHGRISHGSQLLAPELRARPTAYFGDESGLGLALELRRPRGKLAVGVLGLGVGTIAAHARGGDRVRFYEVDPLVVRMAEEHFTFLADARARGVTVELVEGDARLAMERERERGGVGPFDVLAVDAFSGDAPPIHLLTRESFALYLEALAPRGILAINVSNRFVDLERVVAGLARERGLTAVSVADAGDPARALYPSDWVLVVTDERMLDHEELELADEAGAGRAPVVWTDDHAGLLGLVRLGPL